MPFFPQTTVDGKSQGSDLSQVMEWMETSGKTTHLWVNNIDMDILVRPQAEHLCNCLIHTYRFCHKNERGQQRSQCPQQVSSALQVQNQHSETVMKHKFQAKMPGLFKPYSHDPKKSRFRTICPFFVKILILPLLNRQSIDFLMKLNTHASQSKLQPSCHPSYDSTVRKSQVLPFCKSSLSDFTWRSRGLAWKREEK